MEGHLTNNGLSENVKIMKGKKGRRPGLDNGIKRT